MSNWSSHPGNAGGFLFHNDGQEFPAIESLKFEAWIKD